MLEKKLSVFLQKRKASEVFVDYAMPYLNIILNDIEHEPSTTDLENILRLPWCIWNKVVAESDLKQELSILLEQALRLYYYNIPPGGEQLIEDLKTRKRKKFKQYNYYLGRYQVYSKSNGTLIIKVEYNRELDLANLL